MLLTRLIPCLDVRDGRVVKGVRFQDLRDAGDPAELAECYERDGADEIVLLDVSATPLGRRTACDTVHSVRARLGIPLSVGGGVGSVDDAARLLDAGADRVCVNSAAVRDPALVERIAERFGVQCLVIAIDAAARRDQGWEVLTHSGGVRTGLDAAAWARRAESLGAGEVLLTSWDRDGTKLGYDLDLIRAVRSEVMIPIIASGGAASPADFADAVRAGADAVLAAGILHERHWTVPAIKQAMSELGVEVRT